jgi:hypothetical protein
MRELALANGYRRVAETLNVQHPPEYNALLENVKDQWGKRLPAVSADIEKVAKIED